MEYYHITTEDRDFLNAHLYARWLAGRKNAEIYTDGMLCEEHCVFHKVITSEKLKLEI
jgi:hypothetical protein